MANEHKTRLFGKAYKWVIIDGKWTLQRNPEGDADTDED